MDHLVHKMADKICLLILCGILCFNQILADDSSDQLVRKKRVINLEPGGDVALKIGDAPYMVNIRTNSNNYNICQGAILSKHTVITVSSCVISHPALSLHILVGSISCHRGIRHNVTTKNMHIGNHQRRNNDGIALLIVEPAIVFDGKSGAILLHEGLLFPGTLATIFGWGCNPSTPQGTNFKYKLRSITVPIMNHRDCVNIYRNHFVISDNDICTYDANKRCGHNDAGAPLVVDNKLAGLHLWRGKIPGSINPDVFVVLQSLEYGPWIRNNIVHDLEHIRASK